MIEKECKTPLRLLYVHVANCSDIEVWYYHHWCANDHFANMNLLIFCWFDVLYYLYGPKTMPETKISFVFLQLSNVSYPFRGLFWFTIAFQVICTNVDEDPIYVLFKGWLNVFSRVFFGRCIKNVLWPLFRYCPANYYFFKASNRNTDKKKHWQ